MNEPENIAEWIDKSKGFKAEPKRKAREVASFIEASNKSGTYRSSRSFDDVGLPSFGEATRTDSFLKKSRATYSRTVIVVHSLRSQEVVLVDGLASKLNRQIYQSAFKTVGTFDGEIVKIEDELMVQLKSEDSGRVFLVRPPLESLLPNALAVGDRYEVKLISVLGRNKFFFTKKRPLTDEQADELFTEMDQYFQRK